MIKSSTYISISTSADSVAAAATVDTDLKNDAVGRQHTHMFYVHNQRNEQFSCTHTHTHSSMAMMAYIAYACAKLSSIS